jgi:hypothetical protein
MLPGMPAVILPHRRPGQAALSISSQGRCHSPVGSSLRTEADRERHKEANRGLNLASNSFGALH